MTSNNFDSHYQLQLDNILDPVEPFIPKYSEDDLREMCKTLQDILTSFKIPCIVKNGKCGTSLTQFEIKLDLSKGAKIESISNRLEEIALGLEVISAQCRREDGSVYIEIPNGSIQKISLREILESGSFIPEQDKLNVPIGRKTSGDTVCLDIAKAPHLLIAGGSGSGKSVCLNTIITNLLLTKSSDELKMILIDPKQVEFKDYSEIPYLYIVNKKATLIEETTDALDWALQETLRRGALFTTHTKSCKNIQKHNELQRKAGKKTLPYVVIIIDEYAALMHTAEAISRETRKMLENLVAQLASTARFAGIHLVIATQRPSADLITKEIKDNITQRICFKVADGKCSQLVIDESGAETLQGNGDFLLNKDGVQTHAQGVYISDEEIENIADLLSDSQGQYSSFKEFALYSDAHKKEVSVDMTARTPLISGKFQGGDDTANSATAKVISVTAEEAAPAKASTKDEISADNSSTESAAATSISTNSISKQAEASKPQKISDSKPTAQTTESSKKAEKVTEKTVETIIETVSEKRTYIPETKDVNSHVEKRITTQDTVLDGTSSIYKDEALEAIQNMNRSKTTENLVFASTFDPRDGESYRTVKIGNQVWMAENFRHSTKTSISLDNNDANDEIYGRLYTWEEACQIAPPGWHLPTREDWQELINYIDRNCRNQDKSGTALKSTSGWKPSFSSPAGTDAYGFNAYATGIWNVKSKNFCNFKFCTNFWTSDRCVQDSAYYISLHYLNENANEQSDFIYNAFSVRLIKNK